MRWCGGGGEAPTDTDDPITDSPADSHRVIDSPTPPVASAAAEAKAAEVDRGRDGCNAMLAGSGMNGVAGKVTSSHWR